MRISTRPGGARRWGATVAAAAAGILGAGMTAALAASGSSPTQGSVTTGVTTTTPAAGAPSAAGPTGGDSQGPPAACTKGANGLPVHCPGPVPRSKLPALAKDQSTVSQPVTEPAGLVDTRTWTTGGGNTFPGADVPFGMVQWSPDTAPNRSAGGGYTFGDSSLIGYSLTHISGPGCGAAGDVPMLPFTGSLPGNPNGATTAFTNDGEIAQAGYYSAKSNQPDTITSEFTATPHSAMGRFTYPATTQAGFLIKLRDSQNGQFAASTAQMVNGNEVSGSETSGHFCGEGVNDGQRQEYTVHFDITFDRPFTASQIVPRSDGTPSAVYLTFDTSANPVVQAKLGISYVSDGNARLNRQTENPGWDFDGTKTAAQDEWNALLGRIQVSGGSVAQTQQFYSNLYKTLIQPNITSDVNGQYVGADMTTHTTVAGQHDQYGVFSGWDTFHSLSQLQAILDPAAASDQAQSLVNYYTQDKILQQWGYLHLNNYVMVGDPAQSIIADYYAFGARDFDTGQALKDMLAQATTVNDVRPGEAFEAQYGYLPEDGRYGCCNPHGYVPTCSSTTARTSRCRSSPPPSATRRTRRYRGAGQQLAERLRPVQQPAQRAQRGRLLRPRDHPDEHDALCRGNRLRVPVERAEQLPGAVLPAGRQDESGAGAPGVLVPAGRVRDARPADERVRLRRAVCARLRRRPRGHAASRQQHPQHDVRARPERARRQRRPRRQQLRVRLGDARHVPGELGISNLVFNSPGFPYAAISLPNGKTITINAPGASPTQYYVSSLKINGSPYSKLYVPWSTLSAGATLDWKLTTSPTTWGNAPAAAPPSFTAGQQSVLASVDPSNVVLQPGASATATLLAANDSDSVQKVTWTATAGPGLTVSPAQGTLNLAASKRASAQVTVAASPDAADGRYTVTFDLTTGNGEQKTVTLAVAVAKRGELWPYYTNAGITDDTDTSAATYDGGGWSYSAQALAAQGVTPGSTVTVDGIDYTWPDVPVATLDNIEAAGQTIPLDAPAHASTIGLLGSSTNAGSAGAGGTATITYTDGSTDQFTAKFSDWTLGAGGFPPLPGNSVAVSMPYRNFTGNVRDNVGTNVFAMEAPVSVAKTVSSITLPQATGGDMHVLAISLPPAPAHAVTVAPTTQKGGGRVGSDATFTEHLTNAGYQADSYAVSSSSTWTAHVYDASCTTPVATTATVQPGASVDLCVKVAVPASAANGDTSDTTITATSATDPSATATAKLTTIAVSVDTLVVDGDMGSPNVESYYEDALSANGVAYSYWDLSADPTLPLSMLTTHKNVVWFTGNAYPGPITPYESELATFLDGGGRLFMSGQDILDQSAGTTPFVHNYLHVNWDGSEAQNDKPTANVHGVPGNAVTDGIGSIPLDHSVLNANYEDEVTPIAPATAAFTDDTSASDALSVTAGAYKVVFLAFPFEAYGTAADKADLMHRVLAYLA